MKFVLLPGIIFLFAHNLWANSGEDVFPLFARLEKQMASLEREDTLEIQIYLDSCSNLAAASESDYYQGRYFYLMDRYQRGKEKDTGFVYLEKALGHLSGFEDSLVYAQVLFSQANRHVFNDEFYKGVVGLRQTFEFLDDNFDVYVVQGEETVNMIRARCMASLGVVYERFRDYDLAVDYFNKSLKILGGINSFESNKFRAVVLSNLGLVHSELGEFEKAENFVTTSLDLKVSLKLRKETGFNYRVLAIINYGNGNYNAAKKYIEIARSKSSNTARIKELQKDEFWKSKILIAQGHYIQAREILENLIDPFETSFTRNDLAELYELLGEVYENLNKDDKALVYLRKSLAIRREIEDNNDRLAFDEFLNFFDDLESDFDNRLALMKIEDEKRVLSLQMEVDSARKKWTYITFFSIVLLLIVISSIIFVAYRRNQKNTIVMRQKMQQTDILFQEVHHRVKNNFQIISSLLNLQKGNELNEHSKKVLTEAQDRIRAMALVHEMLYRKSDLREIAFDVYSEELARSIIDSYRSDKEIGLKVDAKSIHFDLDTAVSLGLILNEAITNSVKYAFEGLTSGEIGIRIYENKEGKHIIISDNGTGFISEASDKREGLGLELITILIEQLDGQVHIDSKNGTTIHMVLA